MKSKSIRIEGVSDDEWNTVKKEAIDMGITPANLVGQLVKNFVKSTNFVKEEVTGK